MKESRKLKRYFKALEAISCGGKLPRKQKKEWLWLKIKGRHLRELLSSVKVLENKYPSQSTIEPYEFCPKCGCTVTRETGNMATYPESFIKVFCARCGFLVKIQDNSPWMHCLEFPEDNYCL